VANLGGKVGEAWDLCDSVQCQVYEGVGVEHPLSDRAVAETRGQILTFQGKPAQTFYHSTCGGHTESAAFQFPRAAAPYLEGVPCRAPAELRVGAGQATGPWVDSEERLALVGEAVARGAGAKAEARELAAELTGAPVAAGLDGLVGAFGLEEAGVLVRRPGKQLTTDALVELLRLFKLPLAPPAEGGSSRWELAAVVRLGQLTGAIRQISGRLGGGASGMQVLTDDGAQRFSLGPGVRVLERRGERWREAAVSIQPGSVAVLWCAGDSCPLVEIEPRVSADEGSSWSSWRREMSLDEIGRRLKLSGVKSVRVLQRGVSGRAVKVVVHHAGGETEMAGLGFRYGLELPDSLFVVSKAVVSGSPGLRFVGRGWGHGVGMCQNGAFGLAVGGASHAEILAHYYPGTVLAAFP
jgi:stage II sporulation protein D